MPSKTTQDVILRLEGLSKRFGRLEAVKDLNLEVRRGEVFGFLGPNGAGKSTTVGMILGLIAPTSGSIELFGQNLDKDRWGALRRVGAVIEEPAFYPYLSGWDNLEALARAIGGIPRQRIAEVLERVNLLDRAKDKYGHYSMGMKQRLGIASTLLRDPELIILDEPANGLDPAGTREVRNLIPQLAHESRAVFLCSHLLHEVQMICNRVAIIKQGKLVVTAAVSDLLAASRQIRVRVQEHGKAMEILSKLDWVKSVKTEDSSMLVETSADNASEVNRILASNGIYASELVAVNPSLESIFLELTGGESGD